MLENSGGLQLRGVTITFCLRKVVRIEMGTFQAFHSPTNYSHQLVENSQLVLCQQLGKTDSLDGDFSNFVFLFGLWYCETLWRGFSRQKICMGWIKTLQCFQAFKPCTWKGQCQHDILMFGNVEGRTCNCSWATWRPTSFAMDAKTSWMTSCVFVHSLPWAHIIID